MSCFRLDDRCDRDHPFHQSIWGKLMIERDIAHARTSTCRNTPGRRRREAKWGFDLALSLCVAVGACLAHGGAWGADSSITVKVASWGYAGERANVVNDVAQYCDGKSSCEFPAANESFPGNSDPSPGNAKGLIIAWNCGDVARKYQFAEGKMARLACE
jgi:hypothetical protein